MMGIRLFAKQYTTNLKEKQEKIANCKLQFANYSSYMPGRGHDIMRMQTFIFVDWY